MRELYYLSKDLKHLGDKEDDIIPIASSIEDTRDEEALDEPTSEYFNGENTDTMSENHRKREKSTQYKYKLLVQSSIEIYSGNRKTFSAQPQLLQNHGIHKN